MRWITSTTAMCERSRSASPRTDYSSGRATRPRAYRPRIGEHPARVFVTTYHTGVNTQQQAAVTHRAGLGCLVEKYYVKRLGTFFFVRGQTRVSHRRLGCLGPVLAEVHSARLFATPGIAAAIRVPDVG